MLNDDRLEAIVVDSSQESMDNEEYGVIRPTRRKRPWEIIQLSWMQVNARGRMPHLRVCSIQASQRFRTL